VERDGKVALIASLEMSEPELLARLAVQRARSTMESQTRAELQRLNLDRYKILTGRSASTMVQIEGAAKLHAANGNLGLLIVDYLQLVTPPPETMKSNREQQVATISRRFKLLAGEIGCPILLLAQLNRDSEKEDRRPRMSDLRESGGIEQDADAVWLLHRERMDDTSPTVAVQLIQAKRRNWQPGIFMRLGFTGEIVTFNPMNP
jgi:replicative DNA helicase